MVQVLPAGAPDQHTREEAEHHNFSVTRVGALFDGRDDELRSLMEYVNGDSNKPLVVTGVSGTGKSR